MGAEKENDERSSSMVEMYYRWVVRVAEYYIFLCFILIALILPFLLKYSWVDRYVKFVYFTAFPLLVILLIVSIFREPVIDLLKRLFENPQEEDRTAPRRK